MQGQLLVAAVFELELFTAYAISGGPGRRVLMTLFALSLAFLVGMFEFSARACVDSTIEHKPRIVKTGALRIWSIVIHSNSYVKGSKIGASKIFHKNT